MTGFNYQNGRLFGDDCDLEKVIAGIGTPAYVYSAGHIRSRYQVISSTFERIAGKVPLVSYACKANSNQAILRLLASMGAGGDIVSGGELQRCLSAGMDVGKVVFSGVSKSDEEICLAIKNGIRQINIESEYELNRISDIAADLGTKANVTFRFNPDVDADTHDKTATGRAQDKFGLLRKDIERLYEKAAGSKWINVRGLHVHIGSQITDVRHYRTSYERLADLATTLTGRGLPLDTLDLGGGIGVAYNIENDMEPDLEDYVRIVADNVMLPGIDLVIEPGRYLVANAGVLLSRLLYVKESGGRKFAVLDAGMNDLIRPTLYGAFHSIIPVRKREECEKEQYDIVGPVCETGDTFALQRELPKLENGELLAIMSSGAYGAVMASNYNTRPMAPEILIDGEKSAIIRERQSVQEIIGKDIIPVWF